MITYNYHTHTKRCGHAVGEDEDYVIAAIENNHKIIGFSDHVFIPNMTQEGIRGNYDELENYLYSLNHLKDKYKDKIEVLIGFECEYFEELEDYYRDLLMSGKVDYLILGQHYISYEDNKMEGYIASSKISTEKYVSLIEKGLKTGLFSILVHPDLFLTEKGLDEDGVKLAHRICKSAFENDVYLEVNQGGMRRGQRLIDKEYRYQYPVREFFEIAKRHKNKFVMGIDAHSPFDYFHPVNCIYAYNLVKNWNIDIEKNVKLKKVK